MNEDTATLTFEEAMAGLQAAVEELRGDGQTLDRALSLYERGIALATRCDALLTGAELRVTQSLPAAVAGVAMDAPEIGWQGE